MLTAGISTEEIDSRLRLLPEPPRVELLPRIAFNKAEKAMRKAELDVQELRDKASSLAARLAQLQRDADAVQKAQSLAQERLDTAQHERRQAILRLNTASLSPSDAESAAASPSVADGARLLLQSLESSKVVDPESGGLPEAVLAQMRVLHGILGEAAESDRMEDSISVASADCEGKLELPAPAAPGPAPETVVSPLGVAPPTAWLAHIGLEDGMDDAALGAALRRQLLASRQAGGTRNGFVPY